MIAVIQKSGEQVATLDDDGKWAASDEFIAEALNRACPPNEGLSVLPFGYAAAAKAAKMLGGSVQFARPLDAMPDGVIS